MKSNRYQIKAKYFKLRSALIYQIVSCALFVFIACGTSEKPNDEFIKNSIRTQIESRRKGGHVTDIKILQGKSGEFKSSDGVIVPGYSVAFDASIDYGDQQGLLSKVIFGYAKDSQGVWKLAVIDWGINTSKPNPLELIQ